MCLPFSKSLDPSLASVYFSTTDSLYFPCVHVIINFCLDCHLKAADIVFLLDSSSSEGVHHFREQLNFVKTFVKEFDIGPSNVQISVLSFSSRVRQNVYLNQYNNKADLLSAIDRIQYLNGSTNTADAITYALLHSFTPSAGDRAPVIDIMIIMTDGQSDDLIYTRDAADLAHRLGIRTFAIGIGDFTNRRELEYIASDPQHVFKVSTFEDLHQLQNELRNKTCEGKIKLWYQCRL
jgi:collagen type VI alpha